MNEPMDINAFPPTTTEGFALFLQGENMAFRVVLQAIIETHPSRDAFRRAFESIALKGRAAWDAVPPAPIARFRAEQVLDEISDHLSR